jgi:hypothetical protein
MTTKAITLFVLALLPTAVFGMGSLTNTNGNEHQPVFSYSVTNGSASIEIDLWRLAMDSNGMLIGIKIRAPEGQSVDLKEEGAALTTFFKRVPLDDDKIRNIEYVYFPRIEEPEVLERMETAVTVPGKAVSRGEMGDLLMRSNAYREIADVLAAHGLRMESASVENVMTKTITKGGQRFVVPINAIVYLELQRGATTVGH